MKTTNWENSERALELQPGDQPVIIDLHCAFFSIPVVEAKKCLFSFTWEDKQFTWTVKPQGFTQSPSYFSQILKADLDDIKFPRGPTLLQYVDDLLLCSPSQTSSQEDSIHLLKILALRSPRKKLQLAQTQV